MATDPPMPDWVSPNGPWCLKHWAPFNVPNPKYYTCLLDRGHEDDCRDQDGIYHNQKTSLLLGQGKMKDQEKST